MSTQIRVLFVCLGNICRSPMAEGVFAHLVKEAGLQHKIEVDSAGTGDWHVGSQAHHGTRDILLQNRIEYAGCARQISRRDLDDFDYILTMDNDNLAEVRSLGRGRAVVAPLLQFARSTTMREVPDPYYAGGFDRVYEMIFDGCEGLLAHIRHEHQL